MIALFWLFLTPAVWLVLILAGIGLHVVYADLNPIRTAAIIAGIGIAYHAIRRYIDYTWPTK